MDIIYIFEYQCMNNNYKNILKQKLYLYYLFILALYQQIETILLDLKKTQLITKKC